MAVVVLIFHSIDFESLSQRTVVEALETTVKLFSLWPQLR